MKGALYLQSHSQPTLAPEPMSWHEWGDRVQFNSLVIAKKMPEEKSWEQSNMDNQQSQVSDTFEQWPNDGVP